MSTALNGYGLRPQYSDVQVANARRIDNGIQSGYATSIFKYQPVALNASGQIVAATVGADLIGVFYGITYFDASGIPHTYDQFIGGTVFESASYNAAFPVWVWVYDDPSVVYSIQADGPLAQCNGAQLNFTASNIGTGNSITGLSNCTASAASLTTSGQGQLRVVGLGQSPALNGINIWGDAYTEIQVKIARHQYVANKTAV